jgi:hypothetical protein
MTQHHFKTQHHQNTTLFNLNFKKKTQQTDAAALSGACVGKLHWSR